MIGSSYDEEGGCYHIVQTLIVFAIIAVLSFEFLASLGWLPQILAFFPEVLAIVAAGLVIVAGVRSRFQYVRPVYWLVFGGLALVIVCGAVANSVEPGPIFAGLRIYLRALPFFFLPAALQLKERQLQVQLLLLLAFGLLQLPIAALQRLATTARGGITGDDTFGTLMSGPTLSVFLVCAVCVLTGLFLRKRISAKAFYPLILLLLIPTMLNETKAVLVIVPAGLISCFVVGAKPGTRLKNTVAALMTVTLFVAVFIPVYDHFMKPRWGYGIVDFVMMEGRLDRYLDRGSKIGEYDQSAGKVGGLKVALSEISRDPVNSVFGLGIGNVSDSALGHQFTGRYYDVYRVFLASSAIYIIFEFGLAGFALILLLYWLLFKDSVSLAQTDQGIMGALAIGWSGVVVVMAIALLSSNIIDSRALSLLFWYFSGIVAAHRMRAAIGTIEDARDSAAPGIRPT